MNPKFNIAVVGASSMVGETLLALLEERNFPIATLYPLTSQDAVGKRVSFNGKMLRIEALEDFDFAQTQLAFFVADAELAKTHAPRAASAGCVVIDVSAQFRDDKEVPLLVPEVNATAITQYQKRNMIASPSAATVQMWVALKPIYDAVGIERVNVATYQSVSDSGRKAVEELAAQTVALLSGKPIEAKIYAKQIAFNALPQVGAFADNGYTQAELAMLWESRKLLADDNIEVNATAVCVPMFYAHAQVLHLETCDKITAAQARDLLRQAAGLEVLDQPQADGYPTAVTEAANKDAVYVGRIREAISNPRGLNLWVVADNMRKGAALNAIQIAEILIKDYI